MEKSEWRETFNRQPVHYLFFDFTVPLPLDKVNMICQVLQNIIVLSNSLRGSPRFPLLGIYVLSERSKCIFPLQSVKHNYVKLQISLESFQASHSTSLGQHKPDSNSLTTILQDSVTQYEKYYQNAAMNSDEWPQMQMVFFSGQTSNDFIKMVQRALPSIHIAYIYKILGVILRNHGSSTLGNTPESKSDVILESSPDLYDSNETYEMISSLIHVTEMDADTYQLESVMRLWLHDYGTDSDHLRLTVGRITLRCDLRECLLSADALPIGELFFLYPEGGPSPQSVRHTAAGRQTTNATSKLPVHTMEAVTVVRRAGLCESVLFGNSYMAVATRCWKIDWDELDRNQQLFLAVTRHLREQELVLVARKGITVRTVAPEKGLPTGLFAFFPARNALLVKCVAPGELILPAEDMPDKEVSETVLMEAKECLEGLERKALYNPLTVTSGLYAYLSSSQTKRMRPTTSFVAPIINREEVPDRVDNKKRKKTVPLPTVKVTPTDTSFKTDFMTASTLLKRSFKQGFD